MKKQLLIGAFTILFTCPIVNAQEGTRIQNTKNQKKENTLNSQFENLISQSNSWQNYKVIDKGSLTVYQRNVMDSLESVKSKIKAQQQVVDAHENEIKKLNNNILSLENTLEETRNEKDSVSLLGILLPKSTYSLIMWSIVLLLIAMLVFYIYRYSNSNVIAKKSMQDLNDLQEEYENYRKSAIEREQKVRRQLQDEINKHR
ncbi:MULTISPECIES: hypothetical protein [Capnocytophaga]|uniref:tRNA (Guanine-N1)-methyltransferase n=1 Tax=Capnocytophaga canis TaxID=1848903 RepID=A0A0B7HSY7_9FLAO|nr:MULTISPECIES: hypothetical protein [Capnocytophaga]ATA75909.1 hypothetical protein CGC52_11100 [Capnocytophaga sp. H2931]RIY36526.1 hypothetical protein CKY20_06140 [Capnocytophaga canis]CEN42816.1 conserved exported hypothetical protein [Capnocytophaga canis]CEN47356.1 conserved exported hypothetical protein [Capnocytophaga canis]CEN52326.1 conserved exported hypothetical protein [Capnocytophaga canis]